MLIILYTILNTFLF